SSNVFFDEYPLPAGSTILVNDHDHVQKDQVIAMMPGEGGNEAVPVMARTEGEALINADGVLMIRFEEREERAYAIPAARNIVVSEGQRIAAGTPITSG